MSFPLLIFAVSLVLLWVSARMGSRIREKRGDLEEGVRADLGVILAAALTLLGLIIGFSFSMGVTQYNQRRNVEVAEANAIDNEYVRAGILPPADAAKVRDLLRGYVRQRALFYRTRRENSLETIDANTARLQGDIWSVIQASVSAGPQPLMMLAISGMNDVMNSEANASAAWLTRIPGEAWALLIAIAMACNFLLGFTLRARHDRIRRFFILPLIASISFFVIADLDSPLSGVIQVHPQNLTRLERSWQARG